MDQEADATEQKWVPWHSAWYLLVVAGLSGRFEPPSLLAEWAESGHLLTRANFLIVGGRVKRREIIPISTWKAACEQRAYNLRDGTIGCVEEELFGRAKVTVRARDIEVDMDSLRECLAVDDEELLQKLEAMRSEDDAPPLAKLEATPERGGSDELAPTDRTGAPGRPTPMHLVEDMMRARFETGEWRPKLIEESEELERLFNAAPEFRPLARVTAKSIRNRLGPLYRSLVAQAASQK